MSDILIKLGSKDVIETLVSEHQWQTVYIKEVLQLRCLSKAFLLFCWIIRRHLLLFEFFLR